MSRDLINMVKILDKKGMDPVYKDDWEIATALICAGFSNSQIVDNFEAVKTMAVFRFANQRRRRLCKLQSSLLR